MTSWDRLIPDYSYIVDNIDRGKAVLITHRHEDHIGGIPLSFRQKPIYLRWTFGTCLDRKIRRARPSLVPNSTKSTKTLSLNLKILKQLSSVWLTRFQNLWELWFTPLWKDCLYGDFVTTPVGEPASIAWQPLGERRRSLPTLRLNQHARSPNLYQLWKKWLTQSIMKKIIEGIHRRIIFASLSLNIFRLQQAAKAAVKTGRRSFVFGLSWKSHRQWNRAWKAYQRSPLEPLSGKWIKDYAANEILIMCTGSQGGQWSHLPVANGTHLSATPTRGHAWSSLQIRFRKYSQCEINWSIRFLKQVWGHSRKINLTSALWTQGQQEQKLTCSSSQTKISCLSMVNTGCRRSTQGLRVSHGVEKTIYCIMSNGGVTCPQPTLLGSQEASTLRHPVDGNTYRWNRGCCPFVTRGLFRRWCRA